MLKLLKKMRIPGVMVRGRKGYIVIDFTDDYIRLPSGEYIPRDRILHIDTERKIIIYLGDNNELKEARYA